MSISDCDNCFHPEGLLRVACEGASVRYGLTPSERRVWCLLVSGSSDSEVASKLRRSVGSVRQQVKVIRLKTGAADTRALWRLFLKEVHLVHSGNPIDTDVVGEV